ncbi:MAG TPA: molybdopterin cofactor-binding domain-containing protein [Verrucomicrobiae bacterium]|nr:molybdopterin cofactor-binding domain-containing protein [Verrucomicrobiae bacterium]
MKRRDFFTVLGGGILVLITADEDPIYAQETGGQLRGGAMPSDVSAWLHIAESGAITVYTGKVEVGQNARTSLTQAAAEELRVPPASIRLVMGDTALTPFDQGTVGSQTTPRMWPQIRRAAASAREMLLDLAAQKWSVDRSALAFGDGKVTAGARSATFGELTKGEKLAHAIPPSVTLAPPADWKIAGTSLAKVNGREIVTGAHKYTYDMKRPGMMWAKVLYPPQFGASLVSLDSSAAEKLPGVKVVREGNFVGVAAPAPDVAQQAVAALKAEWKPVTAETDSQHVFEYFKQNAGGGAASPGLTPYTVAYIAHVPLEPRAAVAEWDGDKLTVWTGTQRPFGVRTELAQQLAISAENVHVIMPDTGSGYGGKHNGDAAIEAARIARAVGRPVKRNWTRDEELTWAYFRPGGLIEVGGKVAPDGTITDWEFHNYNSGPSALGSPYHIPAKKEQYHQSKSPLRQGSYRGLAATANHFVRESWMDELAHSIRMDPLDFRLKNATDERLRGVILAATDKFGWRARQKTPGHGFGIGAGFEKGSYVATCAEVSVDANTGTTRVLRTVVAFECGAIVNPEHLRNQVEGAIVMGLGGALFERIEFRDGKILNNRLSRYRVPRFADAPVIESVLLDRKDLVSAGAGETPIVGIAPAIGNAIFDATGRRIRRLPLEA